MLFGGPCRCRLRSRARSFGPYSSSGALSFSTHSMRGASRREPLLPDQSLLQWFPEFSRAKMHQLLRSEEHGIPELPQSRPTRLGTARYASRKARPSPLPRKAASMAEVPCCLVSRLEHWTRLPAEQRTVLIAPLMAPWLRGNIKNAKLGAPLLTPLTAPASSNSYFRRGKSASRNKQRKLQQQKLNLGNGTFFQMFKTTSLLRLP